MDVLLARTKDDPLQRLNVFGALPMRQSDTFRIEAEVNPTAYVYVIWVDPGHDVTPVYPWNPREGWGTRPAVEEPVGRLSLPRDAANRYTAPDAKPGVAAIVMFARPTPLDVPDETVRKWFEELPELPPPPGGGRAWCGSTTTSRCARRTGRGRSARWRPGTRSPAGSPMCRRCSSRTPPSRRPSASPARGRSEVPDDLHVRRLAKISKAAEFLNALKTDDYRLQMAVFRRSAETVSKRAKEGNLDGATLAYVDMTLTCVKCHQTTRDRPDARLPVAAGRHRDRGKVRPTGCSRRRHLHADEPVAAGHPQVVCWWARQFSGKIVAVPIFAGTSKRSARGPAAPWKCTGLRACGASTVVAGDGRAYADPRLVQRESTAGRSHEGTTSVSVLNQHPEPPPCSWSTGSRPLASPLLRGRLPGLVTVGLACRLIRARSGS